MWKFWAEAPFLAAYWLMKGNPLFLKRDWPALLSIFLFTESLSDKRSGFICPLEKGLRWAFFSSFPSFRHICMEASSMHSRFSCLPLSLSFLIKRNGLLTLKEIKARWGRRITWMRCGCDHKQWFSYTVNTMHNEKMVVGLWQGSVFSWPEFLTGKDYAGSKKRTAMTLWDTKFF